MTQKPRRSKRQAWSYKAGKKGVNRVRVFAWPEQGDGLWIEYRDGGKKVRRAVGHSDQGRARQLAHEVADELATLGSKPSGTMTLFDIVKLYEREVTPTKKSGSARGHDKRTLPLFLQAFGKHRHPNTLNVRDWESFIRRRRAGEIAPKRSIGRQVRSRIIEQDLKLLLSVLNWAERARTDGGGYLLEKNPLRGLKLPKEEHPQRPRITAVQFEKLLEVAKGLSPAAELFVMFAWYTGHRSKSIRNLRWSDVDLDAGVVKWRGEVDKSDYEHVNPLHPTLWAQLKRDRARAAAIGDAWMFPRAINPETCWTRGDVAKVLWGKLRDGAGIPKGERYGWHSFRRAFANSLRNVPLRELKDLLGHKSERTTVMVYLQPDEGAQRTALAKLA